MAGAALLYLLLLTAIANTESAREGGTRITPALTTLLPVASFALIFGTALDGWSVSSWIDLSGGIAFTALGVASTLAMVALIWAKRCWLWVARVVELLTRFEHVSFDARNSIHRLATVMLIFALTALSWRAASANSAVLTPFADAISAAPQLLLGSMLYLALAALGVGWLTRRDWAAVKQRLGLRWPRPADWLTGLAAAIALHVLVTLAMALWRAVAEPSAFEMQVRGARALFDALSSSLLLGGLLAMSVGVGEEVLFRGALQPVFGIAISSLLFVALHAQVALTPAAIILLAVSLGFGLLRARVSTTAAIIAHAAYNAIPFVLASLATVG